MIFSDLLKLLQRPLSLGRNQAERVKQLANIMTEDVDHPDEFHAALGTDSVLSKYASGSRPIGPGFAAAILGNEHGFYNPYGLIDKIDGLAEKVRQSLVDAVRAEFPSASEANIGELLSDAVTEALAASVKDPTLEASATNTQREATQKALRRRAEPLLIQQAGDICMMPNCSRTLFVVDDAGIQTVVGTTVTIDPNEEFTALENLALLCADCSSKYTGTNVPAMKALQAAKKQLEQRQQAHASLIPTGLEPEIYKVIAAVDALPPATKVVSENWNAYEVRRKITTEHALAAKVEGYVTGYFDFIESTAKDLDQQGTLNFRQTQRAFASQYDSLAVTGQSDEQVFDALVEWLRTSTGQSRTPCEALVSYFVQLCEVFRATP